MKILLKSLLITALITHFAACSIEREDFTLDNVPDITGDYELGNDIIAVGQVYVRNNAGNILFDASDPAVPLVREAVIEDCLALYPDAIEIEQDEFNVDFISTVDDTIFAGAFTNSRSVDITQHNGGIDPVNGLLCNASVKVSGDIEIGCLAQPSDLVDSTPVSLLCTVDYNKF